MQERHKDPLTYFEESAASCREFYIPYLREFCDKQIDENFSVLEIGCGSGGNLSAFSELGSRSTGVDIHDPSIEAAKDIFTQKGLNVELILSDIFDIKALLGKFDMILMHDVIEHLPHKERLMLHLKSFLKADGVVYIAFPPWMMPFGGHQQVAKSKILANFPYIHLLPRSLFSWLFKVSGESREQIEDFLDIRTTRITIEGFARLVKKGDWEVINRRLYFINPHYKTKFGMKPRRLWSLIGAIPWLRNFFTTSAHYIIRKTDV